jgi:hypothetical protein
LKEKPPPPLNDFTMQMQDHALHLAWARVISRYEPSMSLLETPKTAVRARATQCAAGVGVRAVLTSEECAKHTLPSDDDDYGEEEEEEEEEEDKRKESWRSDTGVASTQQCAWHVQRGVGRGCSSHQWSGGSARSR